MIHFQIDNQHIRRTDSSLVASGAVGFVKFSASFSEEWLDCEKTFSFEGNGNIYYVFGVEEDTEYLVPSELLTHPGSIRVSCFGAGGGSRLATSDYATVEVSEGCDPNAEGSESAPTEPLFSQLLERVNSAAEGIELGRSENAILWRIKGSEWQELIPISALTGPEGAIGETGAAAHLHIRYAAALPTSDSDIKEEPDAYIGLAAGSFPEAPSSYTAYSWYRFKGETPPMPSKADILIRSATASQALTISDAADYPISKAVLYGSSVRSGEPTPTEPIFPTELTSPSITLGDNEIVFSGITLRSLYGYYDKITVADGSVIHTKKVRHKVFDGSENISYDAANKFRWAGSNGSDAFHRAATGETSIRCSHFKSAINTEYGVAAVTWNSDNYRFLYSDLSSAAEFKSFLAEQYAASTPMTLDYILAVPVNEDITDTPAGQAALALATTLGSNTISANTVFDFSYRADTTLAYNELRNAIIALGANI